MSENSKNVESEQQDTKDKNIAAMINQVIEILDSVKKKAQQLFDNKCPASVKASMQQAISATASTINKTKDCAKATMEKKAKAKATANNNAKADEQPADQS